MCHYILHYYLLLDNNLLDLHLFLHSIQCYLLLYIIFDILLKMLEVNDDVSKEMLEKVNVVFELDVQPKLGFGFPLFELILPETLTVDGEHVEPSCEKIVSSSPHTLLLSTRAKSTSAIDLNLKFFVFISVIILIVNNCLFQFQFVYYICSCFLFLVCCRVFFY